jgi:hypothetical protein
LPADEEDAAWEEMLREETAEEGRELPLRRPRATAHNVDARIKSGHDKEGAGHDKETRQEPRDLPASARTISSGRCSKT